MNEFSVKLNGFSIVPSPRGVSIRPTLKGKSADPEVCLHVSNGKLFVAVYTNTDAPYAEERCVAGVNYFPIEALEF